MPPHDDSLARTALDRVLALSSLLSADLERFQSQHRLTGPRVHLLWVLGEAGPITQRSLASALSVTPRNVTGLVDGLVESGHVTREPHPGDRRATLVTLTAAGQAFVAELRESHRDLADRLFGDLPHARLRELVELLERTTGRLSELVEAASGERR